MSEQATKTLEAPLVEGSLWRAIWIMSWPLLLMTVAASTIGVVDVQVAGLLGSATQAAVGVAEQILFLFMVFIMSIGVGTTAIVSRAYGEGNRQDAAREAGQSMGFAIAMGAVLTGLCSLAGSFLLPHFATSSEVAEQGGLYLGIYAFYLVPFSFLHIGNAAFRAIGNAKIPLLVVSIEVAINIAGDYLTVLYGWPVPGLGVKGIALSAVVAAIVGALISLVCVYRSPLRPALSHIFPLHAHSIKRIVDLGVPASIQRLGWAASVFVMFWILRQLKDPTAAIAAWTIGMRVESFLFMPLMALSLAVGSIVGQNLGAKQVKRAYKAGWHVTNIGIGMMVALGVALFLLAEPLAMLMSKDKQTIAYTTSYLQINALAEPILAVNMILAGALQGAGDTKIPMWVSIFSNWIVRLPLAWFLSVHLAYGPEGTWVSMAVSITIAAALVAWRFQSLRWVNVKV